MIKNIDFAPQVTKKGGLFKSTQMEGFQEIVEHMNEWIAQNNPEIIQSTPPQLRQVDNSSDTEDPCEHCTNSQDEQ